MNAEACLAGAASVSTRKGALGTLVDPDNLMLCQAPALLLLLLAVLIWRRDGAPILFAHCRVGLDDKMFRRMKFRTMLRDPEPLLVALPASSPQARAEWQRDQKLENDPRVTAVGNFLRRTSLEELPPLIHVLCGEMSLVSPRPINVGLLARRWDMVVLDHCGMAWALPEVRRHRHWQTQPPVVVHVAHNHETTPWRDMVRLFGGPPWRRLALWQNLRKIERIERQLATGVDLLCCIAAEDARALAHHQGAQEALVLTPGFNGLQMPDRVFTEHGIALDVAGDVPEALRAELAGCASVKPHGFVDDIAPLFSRARMALVPELTAGVPGRLQAQSSRLTIAA